MDGSTPSAHTAHTKSADWTSFPVLVVSVHSSVGRFWHSTHRRLSTSAPMPPTAALTCFEDAVRRMNTSAQDAGHGELGKQPPHTAC